MFSGFVEMMPCVLPWRFHGGYCHGDGDELLQIRGEVQVQARFVVCEGAKSAAVAKRWRRVCLLELWLFVAGAGLSGWSYQCHFAAGEWCC